MHGGVSCIGVGDSCGVNRPSQSARRMRRVVRVLCLQTEVCGGCCCACATNEKQENHCANCVFNGTVCVAQRCGFIKDSELTVKKEWAPVEMKHRPLLNEWVQRLLLSPPSLHLPHLWADNGEQAWHVHYSRGAYYHPCHLSPSSRCSLASWRVSALQGQGGSCCSSHRSKCHLEKSAASEQTSSSQGQGGS
jgi:hypothetical protein